MATRNYFERIMPRRGLGGFYASSSLLSFNEGNLHPSAVGKFRQHHSLDTDISSNKVFSSSASQTPSSLLTATSATAMPSSHLFEEDYELSDPISQVSSSASSQRASLDLIGSSLKCDDCQTNDGLFQCCHCNQRLCIQCCNKHYKKVTVDLERLHELSDRLVAKIVHTKNDLERQKNETLEQCHKWRVDTINAINKAHSLVVQTIHNEYDILGKEYELFVQKEMTRLNIDQNELLRFKKGNLGSLLSSPSSSSNAETATNYIDTIRKRIETFAKNIDDTGKFLFQVRLPLIDIDDNLQVESRFGDVTRCTSATWQNETDASFLPADDRSVQNDLSINNVHSSGTVETAPNTSTDHLTHDDSQENIENLFDKIDESDFDLESHPANSSYLPSMSPTSEKDDSNSSPPCSSRYALSVENDIELQRQQFYRPSNRDDRYDSAYGTAPSSPSSASNNTNENSPSSTSSLHDHSYRKFSDTTNRQFGSFYHNRRHTHTFYQRPSGFSTRSSPPPPSSFQTTENDEDSYRHLQHVQLKRENDGSLEGVAIQIEQSEKTEGSIKQSRTCVEACGVRRRTTAIPPRSTTMDTGGSSDDQSWFHYRTFSSPSFIQ